MLEFFKRLIGCEDGEEFAKTLLTRARLNNIDECVAAIMRQNVPGDLMECGVWRGGACMLMRALLEEYACKDRTVWVCDSFRGLPKPDPAKYPLDALCYEGKTEGILAVGLDEVRKNFQQYGLEDSHVRYWPGYFTDSLPTCPVERIALLRLDGDMYESIYVPLEILYARVSPGGWTIIDDYGHGIWGERATDDFRAKVGSTESLLRTDDGTAAYWQKK